MGYPWRVILFLVVIIPLNLGCGVLEVQYGNVSNDQAIEVDSRLVFRCHLYPEVSEKYGVTSKDLILKFRKGILTDVHQVDDYTVEYIVPHAGLQHNGMYNCFVPIAQFPSPQLVCSSIIYVGYKPQEVTNFTCISLGYQNLTCSWTPPQNNVKTEYILYDYLLNNPSFGYRRCPAPDRRSSSCTFRLDTKPPYIPNQPVLNFILNGTNELGKISQQFTVNHYEIVKPGEPNLLKVSNVSKTNLMLHIGPPKALENGEFKDGLIYSIKYFSVSNLNTAKEKIVKSFGGVHVPISDLVPHTLYKFEVHVRLNISGDHYYWGKARTAIEQTHDDVPYQSPVIDNSAFDVQVIAGYRTVTIYWKAVPSEYENGDGFHYVVRYHEHYVPSRYRRAAFQHGGSVRLSNSTTHSFKNLDVDTAYLFNVFAANAVGNSSNLTAVIVVDKNRNLLPGPKEITVISYNQGHYDVSWVSPDDIISDFTLFWCKTFNFRPAKCDGPIDWITTRDTHKKLLLPKTSNYQFAVAARQDRQTSGMVWAPCTVTYGAAYSIPKIELIPKNSTSLKVRWSHKCEAQKRVNREYSIHYCPFEGSCKQENWAKCNTNDLGVLGWPSVSLTNTTQTEYTLSQLKPFTCYFAYLRIRTDSGWGENSDYAFETTLSSAPSDPPSSVDAVPYPAFDSPTASVQVSFHPPSMPNGIITRYNILYNRTTPTGPPFSKRREVWVQQQELEEGGHVILDNLLFYSNYSVEVIACVDRACSQPSRPVYFYTGIAAPSEVSVPRVELLDTYVNVTWDLPSFPNGPVDLYQVRMRSNGSEMLYNVSEQRQFVLERQCEADFREEIIYSFEVRGLNVDEEDKPLYGEFSSPAKTILCPSGFFPRFGVGFIVGGSFVVIGCVFALYICYKWTKNNIIEAKRTEIHLPKELESSLDNPLSSYDKFKSGLQNNHDSGIPNDRTYERFFAGNGDLKLHDERSKRNGVTGGRNLSGDSTASGKGQDSISSANTSKTHNSMDSGAEVESPPSPDSFCSPCPVSRDSGLDKDSSNLNVQLEGWCVRRPNMTPETGRGMSLANSEPSVADFDVGDGTEPLVNPVMQPYCKFGLARSASNGIDFPSSSPMKPGYSKFGIVYRPRHKIPKIVPPHFQSVFMATTSFAPMLTPVTLSYNDQAYSKFGLIDQQDMISPPVNGYCSLKTAVNNNLLVWEERDIEKPPDNPDLLDDLEDDHHSATADDCPANDASWNVSNVQKSGGRLINNLFDSSKDSGTNDKPSQIPVIICQGINDPPKVTADGDIVRNLDDSSSSQGSDIMYVENLTFVEVDPVRVPLSSIEIPQDLQLNFDFSHLEEGVTPSSDQDSARVVTGGTGSGFVFNQSSPQMIGDSDLAREIREAMKDVRLEEDDSICKSPDTTT